MIAITEARVVNDFTYPTILISLEIFKEPISIPVKYIAAIIPTNNEVLPSDLSFKEINVFINPHPDIKREVLKRSNPIDKNIPLNLL